MLSREFSSRLHALVDNSFPRRCGNCDRVFENLDQYFNETRSLNGPDHPGQSYDDDGTSLVVVSRNCACGSTLMGVFEDRRDRSEEGERKRAEFEELLTLLVASGLEEGVARAELRKVIRGEGSDLLSRIQRTTSGS